MSIGPYRALGAAIAATVLTLGASGCAVPTMVDAVKGFHGEVERGGVEGIRAGDHFDLEIYDFDIAKSRSGLTCVIARITPKGKTEETEYLMTRLPGQKTWSVTRLQSPTTQPALASAE